VTVEGEAVDVVALETEVDVVVGVAALVTEVEEAVDADEEHHEVEQEVEEAAGLAQRAARR